MFNLQMLKILCNLKQKWQFYGTFSIFWVQRGSPTLVALYSVTNFGNFYRSPRKSSPPVLELHTRMIYQIDRNKFSQAKTESFFSIFLMQSVLKNPQM